MHLPSVFIPSVVVFPSMLLVEMIIIIENGYFPHIGWGLTPVMTFDICLTPVWEAILQINNSNNVF
jgi:hypothetical protein